MPLSAREFIILNTAISGLLAVTWVGNGKAEPTLDIDAADLFDLVRAGYLKPVPSPHAEADRPVTRYAATPAGRARWQEASELVDSRRPSARILDFCARGDRS